MTTPDHLRPGGGSALLSGCSCEFAANRGGRGVGGLLVTVDQDGTARKVHGRAFMVRKGCPVHDPRTPWWVMPGSILTGGITSWVVPATLTYLGLLPVLAGLLGLVAGLGVMFGAAYWYDAHQKRRRTR